MVAASIFALHGAVLLGVIIWKARTEGWTEAALAGGFLVIIFSVGWTLGGLLAALLFEPEGVAEWMNRDTIALVIVTAGEAAFYTVVLTMLRKKPDARAKP